MPSYSVPVLLPGAPLSLYFWVTGNRFSQILAAIGIGLVAWFQGGPAGQLLAVQAQSLPGQFQIGNAPLHPDVQENLSIIHY